MSIPLEHFIRMARANDSGGQCAARKCAIAIAKLIPSICRLDSDAMRGLIELIQAARSSPNVVEILLEKHGLNK